MKFLYIALIIASCTAIYADGTVSVQPRRRGMRAPSGIVRTDEFGQEQFVPKVAEVRTGGMILGSSRSR